MSTSYTTIDFPQAEWGALQERLARGQRIGTTRIDQERGKYQVGDVLAAPWGGNLNVTELTGYTAADPHPYYDELTPGQRDELAGEDYDFMWLKGAAALEEGHQWIHTSPDLFPVLKGRAYDEVAESRDSEYMAKRMATDRRVAEALGIDLSERNRGFIHASLAGRSAMRQDDQFPGYTHHFGLPEDVIAKSYFETPLAAETVRGGVGSEGLRKAIAGWDAADEAARRGVTGRRPRVEAYVPVDVGVAEYFPQQEDRVEEQGRMKMNEKTAWYLGHREKIASARWKGLWNRMVGGGDIAMDVPGLEAGSSRMALQRGAEVERSVRAQAAAIEKAMQDRNRIQALYSRPKRTYVPKIEETVNPFSESPAFARRSGGIEPNLWEDPLKADMITRLNNPGRRLGGPRRPLDALSEAEAMVDAPMNPALGSTGPSFQQLKAEYLRESGLMPWDLR